MKKFIKTLVTSAILVAIPFLLSAQVNLRHPNNGSTPNTGGHTNVPVGGGGTVGAPINSGIGLLLALGLAYGVKKVYTLKMKENKQKSNAPLNNDQKQIMV